MGESSPALVLLIFIVLTSHTVQSFRKNTAHLTDNLFKLSPDDSGEDLTIISPEFDQRFDQRSNQFDQGSNNELKTKQFDQEEDLTKLDTKFYMTKELYNVKDKSALTIAKDGYEPRKSGTNYDARQSGRKKEARRKFREEYQIEEAILDSANSLGLKKPLEDATNNERTARNHTKPLRKHSTNYKSTDFYETLKPKPTPTSSKLLRHHPRGKSPEDFGLRHSEEPPIPDLVESANKLYDPQESDLNLGKLKAQLGSFYDEAFMSITKPIDEGTFVNKSENALLEQFTRNKNGRLIPREELPDYLSDINFKYIYLSDGSRIRTRISSKLKKKMQQFLQTYTKCRIAYKWKDLGSRFWPRYLRHGYCSDGGRGSCSIPPGMTCQPNRTEFKTLLRYYCGKGSEKGRTGEIKCYWGRVQYPVVVQCECRCP